MAITQVKLYPSLMKDLFTGVIRYEGIVFIKNWRGLNCDYRYIEGTYGAPRIARQMVAKIVQEKVDEGHWDREDTEKVVRRILRENAMQ